MATVFYNDNIQVEEVYKFFVKSQPVLCISTVICNVELQYL